jgi:hypothetical protein
MYPVSPVEVEMRLDASNPYLRYNDFKFFSQILTDIFFSDTDCSQGSFFNETKKECQPCPLNTYQPNSGTIECIQCPDDKITVNTSSKMRKECINSKSKFNFFSLPLLGKLCTCFAMRIVKKIKAGS